MSCSTFEYKLLSSVIVLLIFYFFFILIPAFVITLYIHSSYCRYEDYSVIGYLQIHFVPSVSTHYYVTLGNDFSIVANRHNSVANNAEIVKKVPR